jgi:hypothetical protein
MNENENENENQNENEQHIELYEKLFIMRIVLEDRYASEINIIRELKNYLYNIGIISNITINETILRFYSYYNINISSDFIESIPIIYTSPFQILLSNLLSNEDNINQENIEELEDVIVTLDESELDNLNRYKINKLTDNCNECYICISKFNINEEVIELKCNHIFHADCIYTYLSKYNHKCPVCRKSAGFVKYSI